MDFSGLHYPENLILQTICWYFRYNPSYRYRKEILEERGVEIDHNVYLYKAVDKKGDTVGRMSRSNKQHQE